MAKKRLTIKRPKPTPRRKPALPATPAAPAADPPPPRPAQAPNPGWMQSGDDPNNLVAAHEAQRRRSFNALTSSGPSGVPPVLQRSIETTVTTSVTRASPTSGASSTQSTFERKLLERPAGIRDAARALAKAITDQIEELNGSRPNDAEGLKRHNDFVEFLEMIAAGLGQLADALDQAAVAETQSSAKLSFLSKAAKIAEDLQFRLMKWLEGNNYNLVDYAIRLSTFAAGVYFLHECGLDEKIAALASYRFVGQSFPKPKPPKKTPPKPAKPGGRKLK
jgi:hypothetical protein